VKLSRRIALAVAGGAAVVAFVALLAWRESRYPLRYLAAGRVHMARARSARGRRSRDLRAGELHRLCELLAAARRIRPFHGRRSVTVELMTLDYGRVVVHDFGSAGAELQINADSGKEESCSVHSGRLGEFLQELASELAVPGPEKRAATAKRGGP
jgi:hypothetical protein